jgi:hypothetical protein
MRHRPLSAIIPCLCSLNALMMWCSAEDPRWTPFVDIGYAPSVDRVDHADFTDKGSGSLALGSALRQNFQGGWGYMVGVEAFDTYGKSDGDQQSASGVSVKTNDLGLRIESGPIYDFTREWSIALIPYVGLGWAHFVYSGGFANDSDDGVDLTYGAKLALHYAFNRGFRAGIYGGWEGMSVRLKSQSSGDKYNATGDGPVAGLTFGWLF